MKILSLTILSPGREEIVLPLPESGDPKGLWFTLKEGSPYNLRFCFQVTNNIVSGLRYTNTVWKTGLKGISFSILTKCFLIGEVVGSSTHSYIFRIKNIIMQLIVPKKWLEHLALNRNLTRMRCQRKLHLPVFLQEAHTVLGLR